MNADWTIVLSWIGMLPEEELLVTTRSETAIHVAIEPMDGGQTKEMQPNNGEAKLYTV